MTLFKDAAALAAHSTVTGTVKDVLDDLVALAFNVLAEGRFNAKAGLYTIHGGQSPYMVNLDKYAADPQAWEALQGLFMTLLATIKEAEPFADVLGAAYDAHLGKVHGQFLTPAKLAADMAKLLERRTNSTCTRVMDPACGAGALLLGYLRDTYAQDGAAGVAKVSVRANDLDPHMCRMTTVQVVLGSIVHRLPLYDIAVSASDAITGATPPHGGQVFEARRI